MDRKLSSKDALPEQIQEYEKRMVIIGSDLVQLYPNLEVDKVVQRVKEAVVESEIVWQDFDYLEGVRYLALNWTQDQCNRHELRRVLPVRRGKTRTRPSILGTGPAGPTKGDQEQWRFMNVELTDKERLIIGEVVSMATKAMFHHHYYKLGGTTYHQTQGEQIGLRGTCAIARLAMQMFDVK